MRSPPSILICFTISLASLVPSSDETAAAGTCGETVSALSARVVGGQNSDLGEWPWHAVVAQFRGTGWAYQCSGTLIASQWVVTAAQCFSDASTPTVVILGGHHWNISLSGSNWQAIRAILCHEGFNEATNENNICLIKLAFEVSYTSRISPACLPDQGERAYAGLNCTISGWGARSGETLNPILQEREVTVVTEDECSKVLPLNAICTGTGICSLDRGGPLVCPQLRSGRTKFSLFGVAIMTDVICGGSSVFTDVTKYLDWIDATRKNSSDGTIIGTCFNKDTIRDCGSEVHTNNTIIRSPVRSYDSWHYPDQKNCTWPVQAPLGYVIRTEFLCFLSLENSADCQKDYVEIKSASGYSKRYCGNHDVNKIPPHETEENAAGITFHSDSESHSVGFVLLIAFVKKFEPASAATSSTAITVTDENPSEIQCAGSGTPIPSVKWLQDSEDVSVSTSKNIYQTILNGSAVLHLKNPKVDNEGNYKCIATNEFSGSTYEDSASLVVTVPAAPIITKVRAHTCNSTLTVEWKPHVLGIGVQHRLTFSIEDVVVYESMVTPSNTSLQKFQTKRLNSSTTVDIEISPCQRQNCTSSYTAIEQIVTDGIPPPATTARIVKTNEGCVVTWTLPETNPRDLIIGINITTTMVVAKLPTGQKPSSTEKVQQISSLVLLHQIPVLPNREHIVSIRTLSCAGSSDELIATGQCVTDVAAPYSLPTLEKKSELTDGVIFVNLPVPDENNGPISCIFIAVQSGSGDVSEDISRLLNGSISSEVKGTYFSIAMPSPRGITMVNIHLGDDTTSYCDVSQSFSERRRRSTNSNLIIATNLPLTDTQNYRIYIVTTTPSATKILHKISEPLVLQQNSDAVATTVLVVAAAVVGVIAICIFMVIRKKVWKHAANNNLDPVAFTSPPPPMPNEPDYMIIDAYMHPELVAAPFHRDPPQYTPMPGGSALSAATMKALEARAVDGPYEIPISSQPPSADDDYAEMRSIDEANSPYVYAS